MKPAKNVDQFHNGHFILWDGAENDWIISPTKTNRREACRFSVGYRTLELAHRAIDTGNITWSKYQGLCEEPPTGHEATIEA